MVDASTRQLVEWAASMVPEHHALAIKSMLDEVKQREAKLMSEGKPDPILEAFISPNESDSNDEAANVVDALFAISRAIFYLGDQVKALGYTEEEREH